MNRYVIVSHRRALGSSIGLAGWMLWESFSLAPGRFVEHSFKFFPFCLYFVQFAKQFHCVFFVAVISLVKIVSPILLPPAPSSAYYAMSVCLWGYLWSGIFYLLLLLLLFSFISRPLLPDG